MTAPAGYVTNGLSLTRLPKTLKVKVKLDAPGAGNWQGAQRDPTTGDWFIAEALKLKDRETCLFHRFTSTGEHLDSMTLKVDAGYSVHPTGWAVDTSSDIYVTWNIPGPVKSGLVKFPYSGGSTVERKDTLAVAPSLPGNLQIALSPSRKYAVIRRVRTTADEFTKYLLADLYADTPKPLSPTLTVPRHTKRVMQGFTLEDDLLFCLTGYSHTPKVLEKYDLATGRPVANYDLSSIPGEPEGLDHNVIGMKQSTGTARRLALYAHNL